MNLRASLTLLLACAALPAQVADKPFTNTDVANMLSAGLPEGTVILAIQVNSERENTSFDTSSGALIELKNKGASEAVMNTILSAPSVPVYEPSKVVPGLPDGRCLYYHTSASWAALDSTVIWPQIDARYKTNWKTLGFNPDVARETRLYSLAGGQAKVHVTGAKPAFYMRNPTPQRGWWVVRLSADANHRALVVRTPDALGSGKSSKVKFDSGDPVRLIPTAAADDVVTLRPETDLAPGEYLVFKTVPGQSFMIQGFEFQVGTI